jgi:hypothetical protein
MDHNRSQGSGFVLIPPILSFNRQKIAKNTSPNPPITNKDKQSVLSDYLP